jgi:predicted metalloprotease
LQGTLDTSQRQQSGLSETAGNRIQVGIELQADCYAGVWAANARDAKGSIIEQGDLEEGMRAAEAIGDDTLQKQTQGTVVPESFTHGSSAQRMEALRRGMTTGNPAACNYAR